MTFTLDAVPVGKTVRMVKFHQLEDGLCHKLLAMGLTPGVEITVERVAPLGDPIQLTLRGYTLSLRKRECHQIEVENLNDSETHSPSR